MPVTDDADMFEAKFADVSLGQVQVPGVSIGDTNDVVQKLVPRNVGARFTIYGGGILTWTFRTKLSKGDHRTAINFFAALPANMARAVGTLRFIIRSINCDHANAIYIGFKATPIDPGGSYWVDWTFVMSDQTAGTV